MWVCLLGEGFRGESLNGIPMIVADCNPGESRGHVTSIDACLEACMSDLIEARLISVQGSYLVSCNHCNLGY
jgi:hypothetical protein